MNHRIFNAPWVQLTAPTDWQQAIIAINCGKTKGTSENAHNTQASHS